MSVSGGVRFVKSARLVVPMPRARTSSRSSDKISRLHEDWSMMSDSEK